ncbi:MAG: MBL fold metallo-hydrolase [Candidatus Lokiarchaeota archaeon]|nr:MBL fold metallo-hydrolase [Candidatus Lokiarchaeota archaeon]
MNAVKELEFRILSDNVVDSDRLVGLPGFSVFVKALHSSDEEIQILFDCSSDPEGLANNIEALKVDLDDVDYVVISHGHWDHVAGLPYVAEQIERKVPLICHPHALAPKLLRTKKRTQDIGIQSYFSTEMIESLYSVITTKDPFKISNAVSTTGEIPLQTSFEKKVGKLKKAITIVDGEEVVDEILDDLSLVFRMSDDSLVLLTGCCHAGLVNTINHTVQLTGISDIRAVVGGLHLRGASQERLDKTCYRLKEAKIKTIAPAHCTGIKGKCLLLNRFSEEYEQVRVGTKLEFSV